jgi:hypothetical protein
MPACIAYLSLCKPYMSTCNTYTGTCNAYTTSCIAYKSSCNAYMSIRIAYMRACNAYMSSCIAYTCTSKRRRSFCKSEDLRCASTYIRYKQRVCLLLTGIWQRSTFVKHIYVVLIIQTKRVNQIPSFKPTTNGSFKTSQRLRPPV